MITTRLAIVLGALLAATGCASSRPGAVRTVPDGEGSVWVYLAALPASAGRLSVEVLGASAVREGGEASPLELHLARIEGVGPGRERLLCRGALPSGRYEGIALSFAAATLRGDGGPSALMVPPEPTLAAVSFDIPARGATVVDLSLKLDESVISGFRFSPSFSASLPSKLATGLTALLSCREAGTVTFFDKATGRVAAVATVGPEPAGIAVDAERQRAYVAVTGGDAVEALDLSGAGSLERLQLSGGDRPVEVALAPDGRSLLVVNSGSNTVSVVDTRTFVEERRVAVGNAPGAIVLDPSGRRAFVLNTLGNSVSVVDVVQGTSPGGGGGVAPAPTVSVGVDAEPTRAAMDRGGTRVYVGHAGSPYLTVLDAKSLAILQRVYVGPGTTAIGVDPRTDRIYLARRRTGAIEIFDPSSLLPVDSIPVEGDVADLAIDNQGNDLLLALPRTRGLRMIGLASRREVGGLDVGEGPYRIALGSQR
jgi:YVTN family beta-propeller protein